eukprot:g14733.t1
MSLLNWSAAAFEKPETAAGLHLEEENKVSAWLLNNRSVTANYCRGKTEHDPTADAITVARQKELASICNTTMIEDFGALGAQEQQLLHQGGSNISSSSEEVEADGVGSDNKEHLARTEAKRLGMIDGSGEIPRASIFRLHTVDNIWRKHFKHVSPYDGTRTTSAMLNFHRREVFVKVDTEGYECAGLLGAAEFLRSSRVWGVLFEYSDFWAGKTSNSNKAQTAAGGGGGRRGSDTSCTNPGIRKRVSKLFQDIGLTHFYGTGPAWVYPQFACHLPQLWRFVDRERLLLKNGTSINIIGLNSLVEDRDLNAMWADRDLTVLYP